MAAFSINFCALGGVADILFAKDWRRMRAWMLAAGVAMIGIQELVTLKFVDIGPPAAPTSWLAVIAGGVMFGYGMALSGGCINRALVRVGAGSLKSLFIVGVVCLTAAATARVMGPPPLPLDPLPDPAPWAIAIVIGGELIAFALSDAWFRSDRTALAGSILIGLAIPTAWAASTFMHDPAGVNFLASASDLVSLSPSADHPLARFLGVAIMAGVPAGAFLAAAMTGNLAFETFTDRAEFLRNLVGASLMGVGGTLALGDTFGQGLSGLAAQSFTAPVAIAGMILGCLWGIRAFEAGGVWGGLKLTLTQLTKRGR